MRSGRRAPLLFQLFQLLRQLAASPASAQSGDGCGHAVLTPHSGTLTSKNYPGTYPNHTACEWRIQAAEGSSLLLAFGDMDIESSQHCASSFLLLSSPSDGTSHGPYCGNSNPVPKGLVMNTSSVTVQFNSTTHRSGRGFLLSYTTSHHPDLISCLDKGTHYNQEQISVFCPAGCKGVAGDIWGNTKHGYRDTSVLCKAAIHAGVILDELGGQLTLSQEKGITLYESAFANGLHSKRGSLSEKRLIFHKACDDTLEAVGFNASSSWHEVNTMGQYKPWTAERAAFSAHGNSWAADPSSETEWLEIDLGGRKNITGIRTKGSSGQYKYYVKSYRIFSSRDGKNWKGYRYSSRHEDKVFEGNTDSLQEVSNTFLPPIQARYLRIVPQSWNHRIALKVALQGCQVARLKVPRPYVPSAPKEVPILTSIPANHTPIPGVTMNPEKAGSMLLVMLLTGGFVLLSSGLLLLALLCYKKKRKTAADLNCSLMKGYPKLDSSQVCSSESLQPSSSELTSFPMAGTPLDLSGAHSPEYADPDVIQVSPNSQIAPSTFKPPLDEGYTLPLVVNHYHVPGKYHEYAEPLPPEPEYATPFMEQVLEAGGAATKNICIIKIDPTTQGRTGSLTSPTSLGIHSQYDFPAHRPSETLNGSREEGSHQASIMYMEPQTERTPTPWGDVPTGPTTSPEGHCLQLRDSPLTHIYHEPL